jgi:hypothetical protein
LEIVIEGDAILQEAEDEFRVRSEAVVDAVRQEIQNMLNLRVLALLQLTNEGHSVLHGLLNFKHRISHMILKDLHTRAVQVIQIMACTHYILPWPSLLVVLVGKISKD